MTFSNMCVPCALCGPISAQRTPCFTEEAVALSFAYRLLLELGQWEGWGREVWYFFLLPPAPPHALGCPSSSHLCRPRAGLLWAELLASSPAELSLLSCIIGQSKACGCAHIREQSRATWHAPVRRGPYAEVRLPSGAHSDPFTSRYIVL